MTLTQSPTPAPTNFGMRDCFESLAAEEEANRLALEDEAEAEWLTRIPRD